MSDTSYGLLIAVLLPLVFLLCLLGPIYLGFLASRYDIRKGNQKWAEHLFGAEIAPGDWKDDDVQDWMGIKVANKRSATWRGLGVHLAYLPGSRYSPPSLLLYLEFKPAIDLHVKRRIAWYNVFDRSLNSYLKDESLKPVRLRSQASFDLSSRDPERLLSVFPEDRLIELVSLLDEIPSVRSLSIAFSGEQYPGACLNLSPCPPTRRVAPEWVARLADAVQSR